MQKRRRNLRPDLLAEGQFHNLGPHPSVGATDIRSDTSAKNRAYLDKFWVLRAAYLFQSLGASESLFYSIPLSSYNCTHHR